jgi:ATP phosphoribosyltransferase
MPFGGPVAEMVTLHCPVASVHLLASVLRERGAETVSIASLDYVFARDNPLYAALEARLERNA